MGELSGFHPARFRWVPAPGPMASDQPQSTRTAFQWRQLGIRFDEARRLVRDATPDPTHQQTIARHATKAVQLGRCMAKDSAQLAATVSCWLAAMFCALSARSTNVMAALAAVQDGHWRNTRVARREEVIQPELVVERVCVRHSDDRPVRRTSERPLACTRRGREVHH